MALVLIPMGVDQFKPESLTPLGRWVNQMSINIALGLSLLSTFLGTWYVIFAVGSGILGCAIIILEIAYCFIIIAFLFPAAINTIPPLWTYLFYRQFEVTQDEDLQAIASEDNGEPES